MTDPTALVYAEYLREFGIYFILGWFMIRIEKILKNNTDAINKLKECDFKNR